MFELPNIFTKLKVDADAMKPGFADARRQTHSFKLDVESSMSSLGTSIVAPIAKWSAALAGAGVAGAAGLGVWAIKLAADMEQTNVSFTTMLGSAEKAKALISDIRHFADVTPFDTKGMLDVGRALLSFGTASDQIIPTMRVLGDVAAGLNIPFRELADIYGKAGQQGRLNMEDLNQLTGRGIPIVKELAKQWNVAESDVRTLVEAGKFGFGDFQKALVSLTSAGGMFANMMDAQSRTVSGLFSTLQSDVEGAMTSIGESLTKSIGVQDAFSGIDAAIKSIADVGLPMLDDFLGKLGNMATIGTSAGGFVFDAAELMAKGFATVLDSVNQLLAGIHNLRAASLQAVAGARNFGLESQISHLEQVTRPDANYPAAFKEEQKKKLAELKAQRDWGANEIAKEIAAANAAMGNVHGTGGVTAAFEKIRGQLGENLRNSFIDAQLNKLMPSDSDALKITPTIDTKGIDAELKKWLPDEDSMKPMFEQLDRWREGLKGPLEKYQEIVGQIEKWHDLGIINNDELQRGLDKAGQDLEKTDAKRQARSDPKLAEFLRAGSADVARLQFALSRGVDDQIPREQLASLKRQEERLEEISGKLNFGVLDIA